MCLPFGCLNPQRVLKTEEDHSMENNFRVTTSIDGIVKERNKKMKCRRGSLGKPDILPTIKMEALKSFVNQT